MTKCKRCTYSSVNLGVSNVQWCPELECYVELCLKCKTPEIMARGYELTGGIFD